MTWALRIDGAGGDCATRDIRSADRHPPPFEIPIISWLCGIFAVSILVMRGRTKPLGRARIGAVTVLAAAAVLLASFGRVSFARPFSNPPTISELEGEQILGGLLHNIYRAFDHRSEELIYDRLERSTTDTLLQEVYLNMRKSMELENQGGARVKIKKVTVEQATLDVAQEGSRLTYRCRWNVIGSVGHWGHLHLRTNRYEAILKIEPVDGVWKITAMEICDTRRITPGTTRGVRPS